MNFYVGASSEIIITDRRVPDLSYPAVVMQARRLHHKDGLEQIRADRFVYCLNWSVRLQWSAFARGGRLRPA
jgi:hypothetical protein